MPDRKSPLFDAELSDRGYVTLRGPGITPHSNWVLLSCGGSIEDLCESKNRLSEFLHAAYDAGYKAAQDDIRKALGIHA